MRYEVERAVSIAAPIEVVYDLVADLRRWRSWVPWEDMDPTMARTYDGPASGVGARSRWSGGRFSAEGFMLITAAEAPRAIDCDVQIDRPVRSRASSTFRLRTDGRRTEVTWWMAATRSRSGLVGRLAPVDVVVGRALAEGLARLRSEAERAAAEDAAA